MCKAVEGGSFIYFLYIRDSIHGLVCTMNDLQDAAIFCESCNKKAIKRLIDKHGFTLRAWQCPSCDNEWIHPLDAQEYERFKNIAQKTFRVKLRLVGNSYAISIPREIISFQEELLHDIDEIIKMSLDGPERLSIFFTKKGEKGY